jgi:hypothetical protein
LRLDPCPEIREFDRVEECDHFENFPVTRMYHAPSPHPPTTTTWSPTARLAVAGIITNFRHRSGDLVTGDSGRSRLSLKFQPTVRAWEHAVATGEPHDVQYRLRRPDGMFRWFSRCGPACLDTGRTREPLVRLLIDIDDRKNVEETLRRAEIT